MADDQAAILWEPTYNALITDLLEVETTAADALTHGETICPICHEELADLEREGVQLVRFAQCKCVAVHCHPCLFERVMAEDSEQDSLEPLAVEFAVIDPELGITQSANWADEAVDETAGLLAYEDGEEVEPAALDKAGKCTICRKAGFPRLKDFPANARNLSMTQEHFDLIKTYFEVPEDYQPHPTERFVATKIKVNKDAAPGFLASMIHLHNDLCVVKANDYMYKDMMDWLTRYGWQYGLWTVADVDELARKVTLLSMRRYRQGGQ